MKPPPPNYLFTVVSAHERSYDNPIRVRRGDLIVLTGKREEWDGWTWLWAEAGGRMGWVPDDLPERAGALWRAAYDYSALELTLRPGDRLVGLRSSHGWVWCLDDDGEEGWAPQRCLAAAD